MLNPSATGRKKLYLLQQRSAGSPLFPSWVWHTAPLKAYSLQPSAQALSGCHIIFTEAYFHNILSGSTYLSTSKIPTPLILHSEIYFLYTTQCVGKKYGNVISDFCIWHEEENIIEN